MFHYARIANTHEKIPDAHALTARPRARDAPDLLRTECRHGNDEPTPSASAQSTDCRRYHGGHEQRIAGPLTQAPTHPRLKRTRAARRRPARVTPREGGRQRLSVNDDSVTFTDASGKAERHHSGRIPKNVAATCTPASRRSGMRRAETVSGLHRRGFV